MVVLSEVIVGCVSVSTDVVAIFVVVSSVVVEITIFNREQIFDFSD